ncbi:MAG: complex I subunit 5 family protein [Oscillospiraceae bacterium]
MDFTLNFPLFAIILSLICSVVSSLLDEKKAKWLSLILTSLVFAASCALITTIIRLGSAQTYLMGHFTAPWGNELRFGILEPLFMAIFSAVILLCLIGGQKQLEKLSRPQKRNLYFSMIDLVIASLIVLTHTNDIFTGYVFIEVCMLSSCGILIIRKNGKTIAAATRYMIFSLLGSGLFLFGVIILYGITGHLLMPNLKTAVASIWESGQYVRQLIVSMIMITVGLAIKSGMFPFYYWMPDTYGTAPSGTAGILSGVISKGYVILLIKIIFCVFGADIFYASGVQDVLYMFGAAGVILGSVSAIREKSIGRMIAFSSAAQMGYIYMGIGISPQTGMIAALLHIASHAVTKPLLFLSSSGLSAVSGRKGDLERLKGSAFRNPAAGVGFVIGALSMVGIPGFVGFISKLLFAYAALEEPRIMLVTLIVLAVSTILNSVYFLGTMVNIYTPTVSSYGTMRVRQARRFFFSIAAFSALNVLFGLWSKPLTDILQAGLSMMG